MRRNSEVLPHGHFVKWMQRLKPTTKLKIAVRSTVTSFRLHVLYNEKRQWLKRSNRKEKTHDHCRAFFSVATLNATVLIWWGVQGSQGATRARSNPLRRNSEVLPHGHFVKWMQRLKPTTKLKIAVRSTVTSFRLPTPLKKQKTATSKKQW